jgi:hypothetical protein
MFERSRIDNRHGEIEKIAHSVELTLKDGEVICGRLYMPVTRSLGDELNAQSGFLEVEAFDGERSFLSKQSVVTVRSLALPRNDQLTRQMRQIEGFDPHAILQVPRDADRDAIRSAYHRLVKMYHPDRFTGIELPPEVAEYLSAIVRRLNAANSMLQASTRGETARPATA